MYICKAMKSIQCSLLVEVISDQTWTLISNTQIGLTPIFNLIALLFLQNRSPWNVHEMCLLVVFIQTLRNAWNPTFRWVMFTTNYLIHAMRNWNGRREKKLTFKSTPVISFYTKSVIHGLNKVQGFISTWRYAQLVRRVDETPACRKQACFCMDRYILDDKSIGDGCGDEVSYTGCRSS